MKKISDDLVRGGAKSPLTSNEEYFLDKILSGKEVKIDWFQVTFDFIKVEKTAKNYYKLDYTSPLLSKLLKILKRKESIYELQEMEKPHFGYKHGYYIDEHIFLNYGGFLNKREKFPLTFEMSGQGCRTFEIMGGDWIELFQYFQEFGSDDLNVGRIDIAIDDFDGEVITPYQILPYIVQNEVVTQFRSYDVHYGGTLGNDSVTSGFTITLGMRGRNQLQIYDKRLERDAKDQPDKDTPVWYRYEMRFVKEKARQVMDLYTASVINNDSSTFMKYAKQLLLASLELKVRDPNQSSNKTLWEIEPRWKEFTDSLEKINLNTKSKIDTTIERKVAWAKTDLATTFMEFYLAFGEEFGAKLYEWMGDGKFERKHLNRMNNYLREKGQKELTMDDIKLIQKQLTDIVKALKIKDGEPSNE